MEGKIRRLFQERGIRVHRSENGREVFFHLSTLEVIDFDALEEGSNIKFNLERKILEAIEQ